MTKVIFTGNIYAGDDGICPVLYNVLKNEELEIEMLELSGPDIIEYVDDKDHVILVDAVKSNTMGDVVILTKSEILERRPLSGHDFGAGEAIQYLSKLKPDVKVDIVGITVGNKIGQGFGLSEGLKKRIPQISSKLAEEILRLKCA